MEIILQWGLDVIRIIQQVQNPLLNNIFLAITSLGSSMSFLLVLPLLFWCVDYNLGVRLTVLCCISSFCNFFLKDFFSQPRPFKFDPGVAIGTAPVELLLERVRTHENFGLVDIYTFGAVERSFSLRSGVVFLSGM